MDDAKRARLEADGWAFGSAEELLGLTGADIEDIRAGLAEADAGLCVDGPTAIDSLRVEIEAMAAAKPEAK